MAQYKSARETWHDVLYTRDADELAELLDISMEFAEKLKQEFAAREAALEKIYQKARLNQAL